MNHLEKMSKANIKMSSKKYQFFEYYVRILTLKLGDSPIQGTNARKVISEVYSFLYCSGLSLAGKVNTRRMSQPDKEPIFTKIIYEIFWS